jgi:hypothetical protein
LLENKTLALTKEMLEFTEFIIPPSGTALVLLLEKAMAPKKVMVEF